MLLPFYKKHEMKIYNFFYHLRNPFTLQSGQSLSDREKKISKLSLLLTPIGFYIVSYHFKRKLDTRVCAESYPMAQIRSQVSSRENSGHPSNESGNDDMASRESTQAIEEWMPSEEEIKHRDDANDLSFLELVEKEEFLALDMKEKLNAFLGREGPALGVKLKGLLERHERLFFAFFEEALLSINQKLVKEFLAQLSLQKLVAFIEKPNYYPAVVSYVYPGLMVEKLDLSSSHLLLFKRSLYMLLGKLPSWINNRDFDGFGTLILQLEKRKIETVDRLKDLCAIGVIENKEFDAEKSFEILIRYGWQGILETKRGRDIFFDKLFGTAKDQYLSFFEKDERLFNAIPNIDFLKDQAESANLDWSLCLRYIKLFYRELLIEAIHTALDSNQHLEVFVPALDQALVLEFFEKKYDNILIINEAKFPIHEKFLLAFAKWDTLFLGGKDAIISSTAFDRSSLRLIVSFLAVRTHRYLNSHQVEWQEFSIKRFERLLTYDQLFFFKHSDLFSVAYSLNLVPLLTRLLDYNKINRSNWFADKFKKNKKIYNEYINTNDPKLILEDFQELEDAFVHNKEFPRKDFYRLMILTDKYKYYQVMLALSQTKGVSVFPSMYQYMSADNCDEFFELYSDCFLTFQNEMVATNQLFLSSLFSYFDFILKRSHAQFQAGQLDCSQLPIPWDVLKTIHTLAKRNQFPPITDANIGELMEALQYLNPDVSFEYFNAANWVARLKSNCEDWLLAHRKQFTFYQYLEWVRQDGGYGFLRAADLLDEEVVDHFGDETLEFFAKNGSFVHGIHDQVDELLRGNLNKRQLINLYFQLREEAPSEDTKKFWSFLIASEPERCKPILEEYFKNNNHLESLDLLQTMDSKDALEVMTSGKYTLSFKDGSSSFLISVRQLKKIFPDRIEDSIRDVLSEFEKEIFLNLIKIHFFENEDVLEDSNVFKIYDLAKIFGLNNVKLDAVAFINSRLDEIIRYDDWKVFSYRAELIARPRLLDDRLKEIDKLIIQGRFRLWQGNLPSSTMLNVDSELLDQQRLERFTTLTSLTININANQAPLLKGIASYASNKEIHLEIDHDENLQDLKECLEELPKNWNIASIRLIISQLNHAGRIDRVLLGQLNKFPSLKKIIFVNESIDPRLDLSLGHIISFTFEETSASRVQLLNLTSSVKSLHFIETCLNYEDVKELCEKLSLEELTLTLHEGLQARHVRRLKKEFPHIKFNCG